MHGFLSVPSWRHRRYYRTSSSSFPGPYSVPPGVTSVTLGKASEVKKQSVGEETVWFFVRFPGFFHGDHAFRGMQGRLLVELVAFHVWRFPRESTNRSLCRLRAVDSLWVESLAVPG